MDLYNQATQSKYGVYSGTGTATTVFVFPHNLPSTPTHISMTAMNTLSAALFSTTWDATNVTVTYLTALTGALSLGWLATV